MWTVSLDYISRGLGLQVHITFLQDALQASLFHPEVYGGYSLSILSNTWYLPVSFIKGIDCLKADGDKMVFEAEALQ